MKFPAKIACYTEPLLAMKSRFPAASASLLAILAVSAMLAAQDVVNPWSDPAAEFVKRVRTKAGSPTSAALIVENRSRLSETDFSLIKQALEQQTRISGTRLSRPDAAQAEIRVSISESAESLLWIAQIKQGPAEQVVLMNVAKPASNGAIHDLTVSIRKRMVYSSEQPILDFVQPDPQTLVLLTPEAVITLANEGGSWRVRSQQLIQHEHPWPRDMRGRLVSVRGTMEAFLPGEHCTIAATVQCADRDDPWIISGSTTAFFSPNRNFFTGVLANGTDVTPFYSATAGRQWLFTGTDGILRAVSEGNQHSFPGFGSELAAVRSGCGNNLLVLVTAPEDWTHKDVIQAVDFKGGDASPISAPLDLSGPVISMWQSGLQSGDQSSADAVVKNLGSGRYEATVFSIVCQ